MPQIIWAPLAKKDYWSNIEYLISEFSEQTASSFIQNVEETLELIKKHPNTARSTE